MAGSAGKDHARRLSARRAPAARATADMPAASRIALAIACAWPCAAPAVAPEPGIYESTTWPGSGLVIDHQGGLLAIGLYTYDHATGQQAFYVGSSPMYDNGFSVSPSIDAPFDTRGYYPLHWGGFDLYRTANGLCFPCAAATRPIDAAWAGSMRLYFADAGEIIASSIRMDTRPLPAHTIGIFRRANFGRGVAGRTPDVAGEWVFVDADDDSRPAWRFAFEGPVVEGGPHGAAPVRYVYRDVHGRGELVCKYGQPREGLLWRAPGCELSAGGAVLFAFKHLDVGVHRMQGAYGDLPFLVQPSTGGGPYRREGRIVGLRIEAP